MNGPHPQHDVAAPEDPSREVTLAWAGTPPARLEKVLRRFAHVPDRWRPADWQGIQPDPYAIRRWREQIAAIPAARLHRFAAAIADQVAAASTPSPNNARVRTDILAQAIALDQELGETGRLLLTPPNTQTRPAPARRDRSREGEA